MEGIYTNILCSYIILVFIIGDVTGDVHITNIQVNVPSALDIGEGSWLECQWDEDGEEISMLTWWLGPYMFYRWDPNGTPSVMAGRVPGNPFKVELESSQRGRVKIDQMTLNATGIYRCEVTVGDPLFSGTISQNASLHSNISQNASLHRTISQNASLTVVDLYDAKPLITGIQPIYQMFDYVQINCSSPHSLSPTTVIFLVNDELANPFWLVLHKSQEDPATGREMAVLGLRFLLEPGIMWGYMRSTVSIKCISQIFDKHWKSSEASVILGGRTSSADALSSATTCLLCLTFGGLFVVNL